MKYANNINDITDAFKPSALAGEELDRFFCDETMEFRTGDKYRSPIEDIFKACKMPSEKNVFLLLGHPGCGKSTELNKMSDNLNKENYKALIVHCDKDIDLIKPEYTDLLFLIGEALVKIAEEVKCSLNKATKEKLLSFWSTETVKTGASGRISELAAEAGTKIESPSFLSSILNIFLQGKADLRFNTETRTEYRIIIHQRTSDWLSMLNTIAAKISEKLETKQPIIILESLEKIVPEEAWKIFFNYAATLSGFNFPVIYTFPIPLSYEPRFASLRGYFQSKTLPMIKQKTVEGKPYEAGTRVIRRIIEKRADTGLFENNVLDTLIKKTGGSLRDLFYCINTSANRAINRKSAVISMEDANRALVELKSSLTRRIERKHYEFLSMIRKDILKRKSIDDSEMLLEMLQADAVLEYNAEHWHDVHPLVGEFLEEQGY